jgi:DNA primase
VASGNGQSDIDQVRQATDLVALIGEHLALRPKGREHVGLCPFHDDHSPSLAVVTHKGAAFYKCHSCGAAGDCFTFVQDFHKMDFAEALRYLANRAGIELKPRGRRDIEQDRNAGVDRAAVRAANTLAVDYFAAALRHPGAGAVARDIITKRSINQDMVEQFQLGYAPAGWDALTKLINSRTLDHATYHAAGLLKQRTGGGGEGYYDTFRNRLMFPICDAIGQPIAFGGRQIDPEDEPKYLNSSENPVFIKSRTLYGLHLAKRAIVDRRMAIVTEGYVDVIACHQAGLRHAVATLGTALTSEHAAILKRLCETVALLFDGDEAGQRAADRALEIFFGESIDLKICILPDELDPDDFLKQKDGAERLEALIAAAPDALSFKTARFMSELRQRQTATSRAALLERFLDELMAMGFGRVQGPRRRLVCVQLADELQLPLRELEAAVSAAAARLPRRPVQPREALAGLSRTTAPSEPGADANAGAAGHVSPADDAPLVPPARRLAERELLSLLICEPSLRLAPLGADGASIVTAGELHAADSFADLSCRRIAALLEELHEQIDEPSIAQLLTAAGDDRPLRELISSLGFEGRRLIGDDSERGRDLLQAASAALVRLQRQDAYRRHLQGARRELDADSLPSLPELLELRRRCGDHPAALARGVRS